MPPRNSNRPPLPKPPWLRLRVPAGSACGELEHLLTGQGLNTVCRQALCPNRFECFANGTATFMILGQNCSRRCGFCAVKSGPQGPPDPAEPRRVAEAVARLHLAYAVVTSVTRDDLTDGGASHFAATIHALRERCPQTQVEVLIPDLQGDRQALATIVAAAPQVLNHNLETVPRLYARVRPDADYRRSLALLREVKRAAPAMITKSGLMLGLGETQGELRRVWTDLQEAGCDIHTMGQYLQPTPSKLPVQRYVPPAEFADLEQQARNCGFKAVAAAPLVRSSYQADTLYKQALDTEA